MRALHAESRLQLADEGVEEVQKHRIGLLDLNPKRILDEGAEDDRRDTVAGTGGIDPFAPGIERRSTYFTTRTITFGVNLSF